jgi:hypothetical protein
VYGSKGVPFGSHAEVRVGGQLLSEFRLTSGTQQGSVLGPLLFLAYVNDIWRIIDSSVRLFADDCIIYKVIINIENRKFAEKSVQAGRLGG